MSVCIIPAKYGQITFIFFVSLGTSCVVSSVSVLNKARFVVAFFGLWMTVWLKSWIFAFPSLIDVALIVKLLVDKLIIKK
jgi:hypothetical protein